MGGVYSGLLESIDASREEDSVVQQECPSTVSVSGGPICDGTRVSQVETANQTTSSTSGSQEDSLVVVPTRNYPTPEALIKQIERSFLPNRSKKASPRCSPFNHPGGIYAIRPATESIQNAKLLKSNPPAFKHDQPTTSAPSSVSSNESPSVDQAERVLSTIKDLLDRAKDPNSNSRDRANKAHQDQFVRPPFKSVPLATKSRSVKPPPVDSRFFGPPSEDPELSEITEEDTVQDSDLKNKSTPASGHFDRSLFAVSEDTTTSSVKIAARIPPKRVKENNGKEEQIQASANADSNANQANLCKDTEKPSPKEEEEDAKKADEK